MNTNPPQPNVPPPNPVVAQAPQPSGENNKMIMWLIIGVVLIVVLVGGIYLYLSTQQPKVPQAPAQAPKEETVTSLESEVNALEVEDIDKEFEAVDKDLQSL